MVILALASAVGACATAPPAGRGAAALNAVREMAAQPQPAHLLAGAQGLFIVPDYRRLAAGVALAGGEGLLFTRAAGGGWRGPLCYGLHSASFGAALGVVRGPLVLVLRDANAVAHFIRRANSSLTTDSGYAAGERSWMVQGSPRSGDIVAWSGTQGLFANVVSISVNDISFDAGCTMALHAAGATLDGVLDGRFVTPETAAIASFAGGSAPAR